MTGWFRWGVLSLLLALGASDQVRADWMLISDSGSKPGRSALFADIDSMVDPSQSLKEGNAVFRGDKVELAQLEEKRRRFKSLRLVEILEDPKGPDSRYWSVEMDGDQKSLRVLDAREFHRDSSFHDLPVTDWQPLSSRPWGDIVYRFAYDQERWRTAIQELQERVKRDGTVSEQTELESLGYQLVRNETDSGFPDLVWTYVWVDGSRPQANDSDLVIAKIQYGTELSSREDVARQKVLDEVSAQVEARRQEQASRRQAAMPDNSMLGSWLGAPESDLVANWGEPNVFSERSGSRYLTYRKERVVSIMSQGSPNSAITKVGEEVYWSEVTFTVIDGKIDQYETDGNEPW
jgi:hypothetical protein